MSYPFVYAINGERELVWTFPWVRESDWRRHRRPAPGRVALLRCVDLDRDGRAETLFAGAVGGLRVCELTRAGWREAVMPLADEPTACAVVPGDEDRPAWIIAGDRAYFVSVFRFAPGERPRVAFRRRLDDVPTAVAILPRAGSPRLLAATGPATSPPSTRPESRSPRSLAGRERR